VIGLKLEVAIRSRTCEDVDNQMLKSPKTQLLWRMNTTHTAMIEMGDFEPTSMKFHHSLYLLDVWYTKKKNRSERKK